MQTRVAARVSIHRRGTPIAANSRSISASGKPPSGARVRLGPPRSMGRHARVEHLARTAPGNLAGPVHLAPADLIEDQDLLPGGRQSGREDQSSFSSRRVSSASDTSRGLPLMLCPRELFTTAEIWSWRTPRSASRGGTPTWRHNSSIFSIRMSTASPSGIVGEMAREAGPAWPTRPAAPAD